MDDRVIKLGVGENYIKGKYTKSLDFNNPFHMSSTGFVGLICHLFRPSLS